MGKVACVVAVILFVLAAFGVQPWGHDPVIWGLAFFAASHIV